MTSEEINMRGTNGQLEKQKLCFLGVYVLPQRKGKATYINSLI
jgi:hypothetical protein